jgi:hypothetical protein
VIIVAGFTTVMAVYIAAKLSKWVRKEPDDVVEVKNIFYNGGNK